MEFLGNILVKAKIRCETGLHIGGNKDAFEIGGIDAPVIRDPQSRVPYIPGSSLKGKMRFLLEWKEGKVEKKNGDPHKCKKDEDAKECPVCRVFGVSADEELKIGPTRLIVRDAYPTAETVERWKDLETGLLYTEWKKENYIDRITSKATPRDVERVPKGSEFDLEMVYGVYKLDGENELRDLEFFKYVEEAMKLLQDSSLGGSGSRGYGKISISVDKMICKTKKHYASGEKGVEIKDIREAEKCLGKSG